MKMVMDMFVGNVTSGKLQNKEKSQIEMKS
jgi:hypothetical protein